jgi:hypothetical protein
LNEWSELSIEPLPTREELKLKKKEEKQEAIKARELY